MKGSLQEGCWGSGIMYKAAGVLSGPQQEDKQRTKRVGKGEASKTEAS